MRGNNELLANKLLVLVEGRSIYIDQSGTLLWKHLPIALTEIKRIEILKGPASAVYGFNAFDGVVSIITKSPEEMRGTTSLLNPLSLSGLPPMTAVNALNDTIASNPLGDLLGTRVMGG